MKVFEVEYFIKQLLNKIQNERNYVLSPDINKRLKSAADEINVALTCSKGFSQFIIYEQKLNRSDLELFYAVCYVYQMLQLRDQIFSKNIIRDIVALEPFLVNAQLTKNPLVIRQVSLVLTLILKRSLSEKFCHEINKGKEDFFEFTQQHKDWFLSYKKLIGINKFIKKDMGLMTEEGLITVIYNNIALLDSLKAQYKLVKHNKEINFLHNEIQEDLMILKKGLPKVKVTEIFGISSYFDLGIRDIGELQKRFLKSNSKV